MSQPMEASRGARNKATLPRRDWILLPLLALATLVSMAVATDWIARRAFPVSKTTVHDCMVTTASGVRGVPNSACSESAFEYPLTEYKFNCDGYLAGKDLAPKPPGVYRIVMVGSSFAMGLRVPREQTFAALLPEELTRITGRNVELYNESLGMEYPQIVARRFNEVLAAQPDMILWVLTPGDIKEVTTGTAEASNLQAAVEPVKNPAMTSHRGNILFTNFRTALSESWHQTRTLLMLQHLFHKYESQSRYVRSYLRGRADSGYLDTEPGVEWQTHLKQFDSQSALILERAKTAGVPLVVVLAPERAQAAMLSMREWPAGYDPYMLDRELRDTITSHGGTYIDILSGIHVIPHAEQYYLPVDGHPDARGHAILARLLAEQLTGGAVPALKAGSGQVTMVNNQ